MKNLALACLLCATVTGQEGDPPLPKVGDAAPALAFDDVLGADAAALGSDALRGKIVVIEFATSWCGGCRASAPRWNEVAASFAKEPVVFLSVTNEAKATAEQMRKELALGPPLAVDLDGSVFEAFGVGGVPDVVVLDQAGRIAAFTHPAGLAGPLKQLLAGEPADFPAGLPRLRRTWNHQQPLGDGELAPGSASLAPASKPAGIVRVDPKTGTIRAAGVPIPVLFCNALDCTKGDLEIDPALDGDQPYDLAVRGADGTVAGSRALAREVLLRDLHLDLETKMQQRKVLVLKRIAGHDGPPAADPKSKGGTTRNGAVKLASTDAARFAKALGRILPVPVVDETGLEKPFGVDLTWDAGKGLEALRAALAGVGLSLEDAERALPKYALRGRT